MIPASQARRRARRGRWSLRCRAGRFQPTHEGVEVHEDHDGGVEAAGLGEVLGRVALDQFDEGLPEPFGGGPAFAEGALGGAVFGGGQGVQVLLEHRAGEGVEGEPAVDLAVPVLVHGQPGGCGGVAFLAFEQGGFVGVGGLGAGDLEDPAAEVLEGLGVEGSGQLEQVLLGLDQSWGRGRRAGPRGRGGWPRPARHGAGPGERGPGEVVVLETWASRVDRCAATRVVVVAWACQFAVEVAPVCRGDLGAVGVGQQPGLELHQLGLRGIGSRRGWRLSRRRPSTRPASRWHHRAHRGHQPAPG